MTDIAYILLGWLLGMLSPAIVERVRRTYRKEEIIASLLGELNELRYTMAVVAYTLRGRLGLVTDEFLDWLLPIVQNYDGADADRSLLELLTRSRKRREEERRLAHVIGRDPNESPGVKEYSTPLVSAMTHEMSICPLEFQRNVLRISAQLGVFNQQVVFVRSQFEKTFDSSIMRDNRVAVESNLNNGYKWLADRAQLIADAVSQVEAHWGKD